MECSSFSRNVYARYKCKSSKIAQLLTKKAKDQKTSVKQLTDLALLAQGMLKGEALDSFIERNIEHIA